MESYSVPLGILKGILLLGTDPCRAMRELRSARTSLDIARDMLRNTRESYTAPQDEVVPLLEELGTARELVDAVISDYATPMEMRA